MNYFFILDVFFCFIFGYKFYFVFLLVCLLLFLSADNLAVRSNGVQCNLSSFGTFLLTVIGL